MDPIPLEDLALLDVLQRIDQFVPLGSGDTEILERLAESGLVDHEGGMPRLTTAGVELCKSLQHRVAADAQASKIIEQREGDGADVDAGADKSIAGF